jgi:outer membrane protein assembly factor BamB
MIRTLLGLVLGASLATASGPTDVEWTAHRGGPSRTGNIDGRPGPGQPKVLWVQKSKEQFLAPLSVGADRLFSTVMGPFNSGGIHAFDLAEAKPPIWSKGAPTIKLPTVGSPAVSGGRIVFGEGMHQTDGSALHCLRASDGRPLWRFDVPGELVHIEAAPTIAAGKVIVGSGSGGVICVDLNQVTLGGKDLSAADAEKELDKLWKTMADAYEVEKKKDPDFAIPPNEAALPKPAPKLLWQVGKGEWHVDAPVLVAGDRVYVSSAFLDKEKLGERALICLSAATGAQLWKAPLKFNSWAGATMAGSHVIVPCSTIRYDPKDLGGAKGEVVALAAADGKVEWRKDMSGAILATAAAVGESAILCDTEGQVRAIDLKTGNPKWTAKCGAAFFAGPAVVGDAIYVADIDGVVSSIALGDGKARWKVDLGTDPAVKAPGMVYGSPVVHGGKLYVGTANLEGKAAGGDTVVVCIGEGK